MSCFLVIPFLRDDRVTAMHLNELIRMLVPNKTLLNLLRTAAATAVAVEIYAVITNDESATQLFVQNEFRA